MNEKVMIQVHENIKKYRKLNNMTQEKLAAALEMDPQYYAQLERGERNFSLEKIVKICSVLHVNVEDIVDITPVENSGNESPGPEAGTSAASDGHPVGKTDAGAGKIH